MEQSGMTEQARHFAEQKKDAGADQIDGMAGAIHGVARELEDGMPFAAEYVHDAASRLHDAAARLHERSIDELLRDFNSFARSQPTAVFGGAILAGFVISRFLKSSAGRSGARPT